MTVLYNKVLGGQYLDHGADAENSYEGNDLEKVSLEAVPKNSKHWR